METEPLDSQLSVLKRIPKWVAYYNRGVVTESELVDKFLREVATLRPDDQALRSSILLLPRSLRSALEADMEALRNAGYYRRVFRFSISRTSDDAHKEALEMQPLLEHLCQRIVSITKEDEATGSESGRSGV